MGRPRKRQRTDNGPTSPEALQPQAPPFLEPALSTESVERTQFENVCNGPFAQHIKKYKPNSAATPQDQSGGSSNGAGTTPPTDTVNTPPSTYPTDVSLWPDFSTMTSLPLPVHDKYDYNNPLPGEDDNNHHHVDPDANPEFLTSLPSVPRCPCLPNLYLTLSTLATLSSFPISSHTIETLEMSYKTAHSVLYCEVCPEKFQSGSQNIMLSATLMTVIADQWFRVRNASAEEICKGFSTSCTAAEPSSTIQDLGWRIFSHDLVRAYVFGDATIPSPPTDTITQSPVTATATAHPAPPRYPPVTFMSLISSFERRQRQWHNLDPWTGEFTMREFHEPSKGHVQGVSQEDLEQCEKDVGGALCLKLVQQAKSVAQALDREKPTA